MDLGSLKSSVSAGVELEWRWWWGQLMPTYSQEWQRLLTRDPDSSVRSFLDRASATKIRPKGFLVVREKQYFRLAVAFCLDVLGVRVALVFFVRAAILTKPSVYLGAGIKDKAVVLIEAGTSQRYLQYTDVALVRPRIYFAHMQQARHVAG